MDEPCDAKICHNFMIMNPPIDSIIQATELSRDEITSLINGYSSIQNSLFSHNYKYNKALHIHPFV